MLGVQRRLEQGESFTEGQGRHDLESSEIKSLFVQGCGLDFFFFFFFKVTLDDQDLLGFEPTINS